MPLQKVVVRVADTHLRRFPDVVAAARRAGLAIDQELVKTGVITGVVDPGQFAALARLDGVQGVDILGDDEATG